MKFTAFLLLLVAALSCRAQDSTAGSADRPAPSAESTEASKNSGIVAPQTKTADAAVPVETTDGDKIPASQNSDSPPVVAVVEVSAATDSKPVALDMTKDLADLRVEQQATLALQFADEVQPQKTAFANILTIELPVPAAPVTVNGAAPAAASPALVANKNLVADASPSK